MVAKSHLINDRDWEMVQKQYCDSEPYNYAVLDDFLVADVLEGIRRSIVNNKGWSFMNWQADELFIRNFDLPIVYEIARAVAGCIPRILENLFLVQHIAFMHLRNNGLCPHSDTGLVTLDLFLTPDEYNLEPETGGLVFYDVKRTAEQEIHEFNARPYCIDYFNRNTRGESVTVPYKYNRAVLFDARTFHSSQRMRFATGGSQTFRINYAFLFDEPEKFRDRYERYQSY
jgi:hypothetical protein